LAKEARQSAPEEQQSFEDALARLEEIVNRLEGGDVTLEESLTLFEEGMRLRALCAEKLERAEKALTQLIESSNGTAAEVPLDDSTG